MRVYIIPVGIVLLLAGCGATAPPPACQLSDTSPLVIEASDRLNPDASGQSLPTIVRVYQLRDVGALEQASFEDVWRRPDQTFEKSLLAQDEITLYPRQVVRRPFDRDPKANFIVAVGIFRTPVGTTWRTVLELPAPRSEMLCASVQAAAGDESAPPPVPHVTLFAEDNHIEGTLSLEPPSSTGGTCAAGIENCDLPTPPDAPAAEDVAPQPPSAPSPPPSAKGR